MKLIQEFREFAVRGNLVDLAVAVVIGAAFGKIVASLVEDIVMPAVGAVGRVDFKTLAVQVGDARILYGKFIQTCVDFGIIALANRLSSYLFMKRTFAWDVEFEGKIAALTPAQVNAAVKRHFDRLKIMLL